MVRFWDTSVLVPLLVAERETARAERWLREDAGVIVWTLTRVELLSALARRRRHEPAAARRLQVARRELLSAWERWSEVTAVELVRCHAERLVESHPPRAVDALRIGVALAATEDDPAGLDFVTLPRAIFPLTAPAAGDGHASATLGECPPSGRHRPTGGRPRES